MGHTVKNRKIGIIGDGQLALMLAEALHRRGTNFLCLSDSDESPVHSFFPDSVTSDRVHFANDCDVFTLENEFHSVEELKVLLGTKSSTLFPELQSYSFFADKISQRRFYDNADIRSPRWMPLTKESDLTVIEHHFSYPYILKTSSGGYDGKGVRVIKSDEDLKVALQDFRFHNGNHLLIEEMVRIRKEVAQGFLRNAEGKITFLPLVETIQEHGVCNLVQYPAHVPPNVSAQIEFYLEKISANLVGIFNFEFFVDEENRVLINEGAPRTHNSQHLTIDASPYSQFDLLAMYLIDASEAPEKVSAHHSVMINVLGKSSGEYGEIKLPDLPAIICSPKLYGKKKSTPGRKLGHVNIVDTSGRMDLISIGRKIFKEYEL